MTRRSTKTVTVLSHLSLTTLPNRTRLGILLAPRPAPLLRHGFFGQNGLDARDIAAHHTHPRGVLQLAAGPLKTQVELLLLERLELVVQLVGRLQPHVSG